MVVISREGGMRGSKPESLRSNPTLYFNALGAYFIAFSAMMRLAPNSAAAQSGSAHSSPPSQ